MRRSTSSVLLLALPCVCLCASVVVDAGLLIHASGCSYSIADCRKFSVKEKNIWLCLSPLSYFFVLFLLEGSLHLDFFFLPHTDIRHRHTHFKLSVSSHPMISGNKISSQQAALLNVPGVPSGNVAKWIMYRLYFASASAVLDSRLHTSPCTKESFWGLNEESKSQEQSVFALVSSFHDTVCMNTASEFGFRHCVRKPRGCGWLARFEALERFQPQTCFSVLERWKRWKSQKQTDAVQGCGHACLRARLFFQLASDV